MWHTSAQKNVKQHEIHCRLEEAYMNERFKVTVYQFLTVCEQREQCHWEKVLKPDTEPAVPGLHWESQLHHLLIEKTAAVVQNCRQTWAIYGQEKQTDPLTMSFSSIVKVSGICSVNESPMKARKKVQT